MILRSIKVILEYILKIKKLKNKIYLKVKKCFNVINLYIFFAIYTIFFYFKKISMLSDFRHKIPSFSIIFLENTYK